MKARFFSALARGLGFETDRPDVRTDEAGLREWLVARLARQLEVAPSEIETSRPFAEYGLDSRVAVQVAGELEKITERRLSPSLLFDHPTIDELASVLAASTAVPQEA